MAEYGPAPWQRTRNARDTDLIRRVNQGGLAQVYDEDIPDEPTPRGPSSLVQSQVPAIAAADALTPPAQGTRPARGVSKWINDIAQGYLVRNDPEYMREYPGSWGSAAAYERDQTGLLTESERGRFGLAGIQQQNEAEAASSGYLRPAGQRPYGPPGRALPNLPRTTPGTSIISPADARKELPLASNMGWTAKQDFVMSNYPNLFKAAQDSGLTRDEVYDVTNFTLAVDAARTISSTINPVRQRQLLMSMPAPQRALVLDVITAMTSEAQAGDTQVTTPAEVAQVNANPALTAQTNAGDEQNLVLRKAREWLWDPSVGLSGLSFVYPDTNWGPIENGELYLGGRGAFDALVAANEMTLRTTNALMLSGASGSWENAWNATEAGSFDPEMLRMIKANNDPLLVDVMVDIKRAAARADDDPIGYLLEKHGSNPQALAYIDQILLNTDASSDLSQLAREVDSAETSNLANVGLWSLNSLFGNGATSYENIEDYSGSALFKLGAPTGNVALTFLLDPTIVGTKVNSIRKAAKYGVMEPGVQRLTTEAGLRGLETWSKIVGNTDVIPALRQARVGLHTLSPARLDEVFTTKGAQNYFTYLGREMESIRAIDDVGDQAQRFNSVASQNRRWFTPAALKVMMDAGVKDHATARAFFDDAANIEHLLLGQAGRRTKGYVVPHMTNAYATTKRTILQARGLTTKVMGGSGYLDAVFGPGTSRLMPEEAADFLSKAIEDDPQMIGRALSDFVYVDEGGGVRTLTGRIVDRLDSTDRSAPVPEGADPTKWRRRDRYGWRREGLVTGDVRASLGRLGRLMAHMPDASRGIPVDGPDGAEMVKELAQALGMSRYFANYLRFIWPSMTEPQRVRLVNGLNRTGLVTSGVDLVNPQLANSLDETFAAVATRVGTQYTASYVDMIRIRANAERVVEQMDRARKAANKQAMTAAEKEAAVQAEVVRMADELVEEAPAPAAAAPEVDVPVEAAPVVDETPVVDEVTEADVVEAAELSQAEFDELLSEVMPYSDEGGEIDQAIEDAIVYSEEGDLLNATDALRDAYVAADLEWPTPAAVTPEAEAAPAAQAWEPYAVPLPDYPTDVSDLIDFEPGDTITADMVEGARPDLWIKHTEVDDRSVYTVYGRREGTGSDTMIVQWDGDVVDGATEVKRFDSLLVDQKAAWEFIQRVERTYVTVDTPQVNQVIDDSEEILNRWESLPTVTSSSRVSIGEVPDGTRTWKRAGGEHTAATTHPRGDMTIVRHQIDGGEPYYTAVQPTDGAGEAVQISWYESDGELMMITARGVDDNVVAAMKDAITGWGKDNVLKVPTKWTVSKKPRKVDDAAIAEAPAGKAKPPITPSRKAAEYLEAEVDGRMIWMRTTVDANGERTNFSEGPFVGSPTLVWRRETGELASGPHYTEPEIAEELYRRVLLADEQYDIGKIPSLEQMRETYGDEFGTALERRTLAESPDVPTVGGLLVNHIPTGRPEMPQSQVNELSFPDRGEKNPGYVSTIQSGKTTKPRAVVVTTGVDHWGARIWKVEVDRQPSQQYGLTADILFDEQGRVQGSAYGLISRPGEKSPYDASNGYDKRQYALLAKAVVQEAARYDIPIRGQLADWLEQMGAPVVRDPEVWDVEKAVRLMDMESTNAFAEFALRRNPKLGEGITHSDRITYRPLVELGDGTDTIKGFAKIQHRNPEVRRLLAEFLGRTDDTPVDEVAQRRVTAPYDGTDYEDRFRPEGRPLGGSSDGLGAETALSHMVPHHDPEFKEVPGIIEVAGGLEYRLRVTKRRGVDGEVKYSGISVDVFPAGAFDKFGWAHGGVSLSWFPDGRLGNLRISGRSGSGTRTAATDEMTRKMEEWVTDVAEEAGLDIDLPWAGYFPRRGDWGYRGDPVDEVITEAPEGFTRIPDTWNGDENELNDVVMGMGYPRPNRFAELGIPEGRNSGRFDPGYEVFGTTVMRDGEEIKATFTVGTYNGRRVWGVVAPTHNVGRKAPSWQNVDLTFDENGRLLGRSDTDEDSKFLLDVGSMEKDGRAANMRPLVDVVVANAENFGYEVTGDLGELVRRLTRPEGGFAPIATPPAPTPVIDDIVEWTPNAVDPEELAKYVPSGAPGRKTKNPIVSVFKQNGGDFPALDQVIPARGGLWVTDRYRLLRLSDADAEGLTPGRKIVVTRTKATIENQMRLAAKTAGTETTVYRELEAELQAAIDGRPLADIGINDAQVPKVESLLAGVDDVARDGTVFTPNALRPWQTNKAGATTSWLVTDGVVSYNAKFVRDLPKGAVIKYTKPDKAAAIVDESGEVIGMLMPVKMGDGVGELPAGKIKHPVHGEQDGWRYTDKGGNTYYLFHHVKEDRAYYQNPADRPKGPVDYGWKLELRTRTEGPDSMSQAISVHWRADGTLHPDAPGGFNNYGRRLPDDEQIKERMAALADRAIDEHNLQLEKFAERGATPEVAAVPEAPTPAAGPGPTKSMKLNKTVYQEFREELGLAAPTRETKTLAYVDLDRAQFTALIERIQRAGKDADETMTPGQAQAARRKYRDTMQSMWDQGAPEEGAPAAAPEAAPAIPAGETFPEGSLPTLSNVPAGFKKVKSAITRAKKYPTARVDVTPDKEYGVSEGATLQLGYGEKVRASHLIAVDPADFSKGFIYRPVPEEVALDRIAEAIYYYPGGAFDEAVIDLLLETGVTRAQIRAAKRTLFDKADMDRYSSSYSGFPAVVGELPEGMEEAAYQIANKGVAKRYREDDVEIPALQSEFHAAHLPGSDFDERMARIVEADPSLAAEGGPVTVWKRANGKDRYNVDYRDERLLAAWDAQAGPDMRIVEAQTGRPFQATLKRGEGGPRKPGTGDDSLAGPGLYLTDSDTMAQEFAGETGEVVEHTVRLENPLVIRGADEWRAFTQRVGVFPKWSSTGGARAEYGAKIRAAAEAEGYDGIVIDMGNAGYDDAIREMWMDNTVVKFGVDETAVVEPNVPLYMQTVKPGDFDVDLEAGTMTQRAEDVEVVPPPNPIPEAAPVEPEVIEGEVVPPAGGGGWSFGGGGGGATPPGPPVPPKSPGPADKVPGLSKGEKRSIRRGEIAQARQNAMDNGEIKNPSSLNETDNYALYDPQLTKTVSIIDPAKMNMLMARSSYLTALLGGGPKVTTATDWWTLATLAGPRFVMRSGLEDFALYAITGGQFFGHGGWLDSRRASAAIREATERVDPVGNPLVRGNNPGMKLGLAATARREFGTYLARRTPAFKALVLPYLTEAEVKAASAMATKQGSEKSRKAIADLVATAFARSRFFSANRLNWASGKRIQLTGYAGYVSDVIKDGVERGYLNASMDRASEVAEHLADGTMPAYKAGAGGTEVIDGTTISHVRTQVQGFSTHWQQGGRNADDVEAFHMELDRSLHQSGYKSYAAIARSRRYYRLKYEIERAVKPETKAKHQAALDEFLDEFAADIADDANLERYVLVEQLGVRGYAERLLDDAVRMMTTADGYYNNALLDSMLLPSYKRVTVSNELAEELGYAGSAKSDVVQITVNRSEWNDALNAATDPEDVRALEEAGEPINVYGRNGAQLERRYGLYYFDEDGAFRYNLDAEGLHDPDIPMPQSIGAADVITVPVSDKIPWSSRAWAAMGRSLARLTREPIYISNYVDAMELIEPFKVRMSKQLIEGGMGAEDAFEMASEWAAKTAADRAYNLTMAYVDNPAIRSQLAWQVRNVARFYRALEDFYRRMLRVAQYEPVAFWKAALAWNVLDDSGFVWEDEYGEKYFVFPMTQAAFGVVNGFLSKIGVQSKVPGLPMAWGARVTMLSPSADPNAMVPTLGSPYSGVTIKGLLRFLPSVGAMSMEDSQRVEGALFGEYSPQQTFTSSLLNDVAGPNISRVLDALGATRGGFNSRQNESETMYATVAKQAIHAMAAADLIDPSKDYTNEELMELRSQADATAMNLLYLKALFTPALPATPQPVSLTVSDEARALGIDSGNSLFLEYLNKTGSYEDAFISFTRDNPGKAIFTVSKYENTAYYRQLVEAEDFIKANREEFDAHPVGLSYFAPMEGTYSGMNGFYFMRANGIKVPVTVETFFDTTMRAAGDAEVAYVDMVEEAGTQGVGIDQRKLVTESADGLRADIKDKYPMAGLGRTIDYDGAKQARRDADEILATAKYMIESGQDKDGRAAKFVEAHDVFAAAAAAKADTGKNSPERRQINEVWRAWVADDAMTMFEGDDRGLRFLRILSTALGTPVEGL